jgi:hypothetical protein
MVPRPYPPTCLYRSGTTPGVAVHRLAPLQWECNQSNQAIQGMLSPS